MATLSFQDHLIQMLEGFLPRDPQAREEDFGAELRRGDISTATLRAVARLFGAEVFDPAEFDGKSDEQKERAIGDVLADENADVMEFVVCGSQCGRTAFVVRRGDEGDFENFAIRIQRTINADKNP